MDKPEYILKFNEAVCIKIGFFESSYMELLFFADYMIVHKPKCYYSKKNIRKDITKLKYADITKFVYKPSAHRIELYGNGCYTWYKYKPDGSLPDEPTKVKNFKNGLTFFDIRFVEDDIDIISEIEAHTPLKVTYEKGF